VAGKTCPKCLRTFSTPTSRRNHAIGCAGRALRSPQVDIGGERLCWRCLQWVRTDWFYPSRKTTCAGCVTELTRSQAWDGASDRGASVTRLRPNLFASWPESYLLALRRESQRKYDSQSYAWDNQVVECPQCGMRKRQGNLARHLETCDGRSLVCRYCQRHFLQVGHRRYHERACPDADGRTCADCGEWKPWSEYSKNGSRLSGHSSYCRSCAAIRAQAYVDRNRDAVLAAKRRYNVGAGKGAMRLWRDRNAEHVRNYSRLRHRSKNAKVHVCANPECEATWMRIGPGVPRYCSEACRPGRFYFRGNDDRKHQIAERDGWHCQSCGDLVWIGDATEDHCLPRIVMEGADPDLTTDWLHGLWNLELLCSPCNASKNSSIWWEQIERAVDRFDGEFPPAILDALAECGVWQPKQAA